MKAGRLVCVTRTGEFLVRPQIDTEHGEYRIAPPEKGDETVAADLSPDGRYLVYAFQKRFSYDVRVFGWDVAERRQLWAQPLPGQMPSLCWAFSPESPTVAIAHPDRTVRIHALADGSVVRVVPVGFPVNALLFLRISAGVPALLMADSERQRLVGWNLETGTSTELPLPVTAHILEQSNDGRWLAVGCLDGRIVVYWIDSSATSWPTTAQNGPHLSQAILSGHLVNLSRLSFALDGDLLVSYAHDASTRFWDVPRGGERCAPALNTVLIGVEAGRIALARGETQQAGLWRLQPAAICRTLRAHVGVPAFLAFVDERCCAIGGGAGLSIWDAQAGVEMTRLYQKRVTGVHVLPHGLLVATFEGLLRWSIEQTAGGPRFVGPDLLREGAWLDLCVSPDHTTAFVSDQDRVWRIPLADPDSATLFAEHRGARPKSVSPDGARLVVGHWAGAEVVVYSIADGSRLFSLPTPGIGYAIGAFTPLRADGSSLLIIATNGRYHFLDGVTYAERHSVPRQGWLVSLAMSPDGNMAMITRNGSAPALIDDRPALVCSAGRPDAARAEGRALEPDVRSERPHTGDDDEHWPHPGLGPGGHAPATRPTRPGLAMTRSSDAAQVAANSAAAGRDRLAR
jgi:WD40 repeat protein